MLFFKINQWKNVLIIAAIYTLCIYEAFNQQFSGTITCSIKDGTIVTELRIQLTRRKLLCFQLYTAFTYDGTPRMRGTWVSPAKHQYELIKPDLYNKI